MTDRLKIFKALLPAEFVLFDYNPQKISVRRQQANNAPAAGSTAGTLGALFRGTDPMTLNITKARIVGPECKVMCDNLINWTAPASGLLGAATSAIMSAIGLEAARPPDLVVQWGPPSAGFMVTAQLTGVTINYVRISAEGIPLHAECDLTLKETPSPLSMTNPTSGGRPGRSRHVVHADETLMSISTAAFGTPGAWRVVADINGIDDPHSIRPGDVIYLPAREELKELAEAMR